MGEWFTGAFCTDNFFAEPYLTIVLLNLSFLTKNFVYLSHKILLICLNFGKIELNKAGADKFHLHTAAPDKDLDLDKFILCDFLIHNE